MSRSRWTIAGGGRRSLVALGLTGLLALSACGGSASETPGAGETSPPGESSAPVETDAPAPTDEPTPSDDEGDGGDAFTAATTALDALDSYAFRVELRSSTGGATSTTTHSLYSGIVMRRPSEANSLQVSELDAEGNVTSGTEFIVIGEEAWLRDAGSEEWTPLPAAQVGGMLLGFRPEQMFGTYFAGIGENFTKVGTESKNGIESTHYQGDESVGSLLGAIAGVSGSWSSDVWIANDGGFLVHSEAGVEAAAGTDTGSFFIVVDITDPNSAGPIEPPI